MVSLLTSSQRTFFDNSVKRRKHLQDAISVLVENYVHLSISTKEDGENNSVASNDEDDALDEDADTQSHVDSQSDDHVLLCACDLLAFGLLYIKFSDAIREVVWVCIL